MNMFFDAVCPVKEVTEKVESVKVRMSDNVASSCNLINHQNDDSIPLRSNKKTGAKSKKEVREQVLSDLLLLHVSKDESCHL
jgi:hypothetical protein